ncbi:unnamed protein product [Closterium sp. Yama58-4]|nr:unnamed protein product [Closterium sp. Yama58-4]
MSTLPAETQSDPTQESGRTRVSETREYLPDVKHEVFKHFKLIKKEDGKAQLYECRYCFAVFAGAAIRCAQHLSSWKGMKRREVSLCKEAPHSVRQDMRAKYEAKAAAAEERRKATAVAIVAVTNGAKRTRITDYIEGDAATARREAHDSICLMVAALRLPEHIVDHPLFINAQCCDGIDAGLATIKSSWKRTGVTISSDMMTDKAGRPQANIFLVNDSGAVFKDCIDCRMESKTGGYVAGIIKPVVEEVGPENVVAFCTDGGSNYAAACKELISAWPHIETPELVGATVLQALKPAGTRFGTQYITVSRLCQLRKGLTQMVVSDLWKDWAVGTRKLSADAFAALILDAAWWKTAEFFCKMMQLPYKIMRETDGKAKGMMGRIYDVMLQLTVELEELVEADEEQLSKVVKAQIRKILKNRWDGSLACALHVAGRILNPANKDEDIFGSDAECTKVFKTWIVQQSEYLKSTGKAGGEGDECLIALQEGVRAFLDMKLSFGQPDAIAQRALVKKGKYDSVKWWQWHGTDAPLLAFCAIRTLSQPVSASPCERGWAAFESVHTARRNRLGSAKCRDLVFVAHNWNVVRNWHSRADVMPGELQGNMEDPPLPEGYKLVEEAEEEEGEDDVLMDEYED